MLSRYYMTLMVGDVGVEGDDDVSSLMVAALGGAGGVLLFHA